MVTIALVPKPPHKVNFSHLTFLQGYVVGYMTRCSVSLYIHHFDGVSKENSGKTVLSHLCLYMR